MLARYALDGQVYRMLPSLGAAGMVAVPESQLLIEKECFIDMPPPIQIGPPEKHFSNMRTRASGPAIQIAYSSRERHPDPAASALIVLKAIGSRIVWKCPALWPPGNAAPNALSEKKCPATALEMTAFPIIRAGACMRPRALARKLPFSFIFSYSFSFSYTLDHATLFPRSWYVRTLYVLRSYYERSTS